MSVCIPVRHLDDLLQVIKWLVERGAAQGKSKKTKPKGDDC